MTKYSSIQRWIYVNGETIPDALRKMADALDSTKVDEEMETINDVGTSAATVEVNEEGEVTVGFCLSYWPAEQT